MGHFPSTQRAPLGGVFADSVCCNWPKKNAPNTLESQRFGFSSPVLGRQEIKRVMTARIQAVTSESLQTLVQNVEAVSATQASGEWVAITDLLRDTLTQFSLLKAPTSVRC